MKEIRVVENGEVILSDDGQRAEIEVELVDAEPDADEEFAILDVAEDGTLTLVEKEEDAESEHDADDTEDSSAANPADPEETEVEE